MRIVRGSTLVALTLWGCGESSGADGAPPTVVLDGGGAAGVSGAGGAAGASGGAGGAGVGAGGAGGSAGSSGGAGGSAGSSGGKGGAAGTSGAAGVAGTSGAAGVAGTSGAAGTAGTSGAAGASLPKGKATIGFWCGPPAAELTAARFDAIAKAGFNLVSNACDGASYVPAYNQKMLALASERGLEAVVTDARVLAAVAGQSVSANLDATVKDYAGLPGLAGYHVKDEPSVGEFPALAAVVSGLLSRDPDRFAYMNLLPDYATLGQLGAPSYDAYVASFVSAVHPALLSHDYYPFLTASDAPSFFANLAVVRAHAVATGTPLWQFVQAISFNGHRATTAAEKRWSAMHALAYGATGIWYFTYWTPPQTAEGFGDGIIDAKGAPSSQVAEVTAINRDFASIGAYLAKAQSTRVFHVGPLAPGAAPRAPGLPVYVPSPVPLTVGLFTVQGDAYALLVNRSYTATTESDVLFASADGAPEALDPASGKLSPMVVAPASGAARAHVVLPPGEALLVHLRGPVPPGPPGAEAFVGVVRTDAGTLHVVDASFGTQALRPAGWKDCPEGYTLAGEDFQSNGFWMCARTDLVSGTFHVGNVVKDVGALYEVKGGKATLVGPAGWDQCPTGKLLGHAFQSDGFWICG